MGTPLPEEFMESMRRELGGEAQALFAALDGEASVAVRMNPAKGIVPIGDRAVPWSAYGRYFDRRPQFTLDAAFHAGAYYVQEAGSQFVEYLLRGERIEGSRILDMCAAPGGKTTIYSTAAGRDGLVVANDCVRSRANTLADNVRKWGMGNTVVTVCEPSALAAFGQWFDVVAVDAPCSGEGMFRKDETARMEWSAEGVRMCAERQLSILRYGWQALRPGGLLLYSTCTFNTTENEGVLRAFAMEYGSEMAPAEVAHIDASWGIAAASEGAFATFRFMPHRTEAEGFFAAVVRKSPDVPLRVSVPRLRRHILSEVGSAERRELSRWVAESQQMRFVAAGDTVYALRSARYDDIRLLAESLPTIYSGVAVGRVFKGALKPDWALSHYCGLNLSAAPCTGLDREQVLDYLRRREVEAERFAEGVNIVLCGGLPLGFAKRIGARVNNMYPNSLRIMNM